MTARRASFQITRPLETGSETPLVFASPHSGDLYPPEMGFAPDLTEISLRSAEDRLVGRLVEAGPRFGAPLIEGRIGRACVDLNRAPEAFDPELIDGVEASPDPKTAAGYGVVPRLTGDGAPLYARRLTRAEAEDRVKAIHAPYHAALSALMAETRERYGRALLVDWHSMPARATGVDVVLGDRHGSACGAALSRRLRGLFEGLGWRVVMNHPYAGGWTTQRWGRPDEGCEAIQVEISRRLYLDEATLSPGVGWSRTRKGLDRVIEALCATSWDAASGT